MEQLLFGALWVSACGGLAAVLLTVLTPLLQKRYSARMRCWVWAAVALCLLVPIRPQTQAAPVKFTIPASVQQTVTLSPVRREEAWSAPQSAAQPAGELQAGGEAAQQTQTAQSEAEAPAQNAASSGAPQAQPAPGSSVQAAQSAQGSETASQAQSETPAQQGAQDESEAQAVQQQDAEAARRQFSITFTPVQLLGAVWAAGAAACLAVRLASYVVWKRRALRACRPLLDVAMRSACGRAKVAAGCRTRVRVRVCAAVTTPLVAGVLRPMLLLPAGMRADETVELMLIHEYTHVRRRDVLLKGVAVLAVCLHWFNPAVYLMLRGISRDVELACDEAVLAACGGDRRAVYGRALLTGACRAAAFTTQFGGGKKVMKQRLDALFLGARRRGALTALTLASAVACASVLAACQVGSPGGGTSAMVTRPLETAIPVAQTELPTYSFPLNMWELEGDEMMFHENWIAEYGLGRTIVLTCGDGQKLAVPLLRDAVDALDSGGKLMAYDGDFPEAMLFAWMQGGSLNAMVTEDGANWAQTPVADVPSAQKLACSRVDASTMFLAAGSSGATTVWRTSDGGASWQQVGQPVQRALRDVFFFSETGGLLLAAEEGDTAPVVLYTADGGETWSEASFPDLTQALDMTRINALDAVEKDGALHLEIGARYKEEQPDGEQFGTFIYILNSTDGGASWNYAVKPLEERIAMVNATRSVVPGVHGEAMIQRQTESSGVETYYLEEGAPVLSMLSGQATVVRASNGTVELRQEETGSQSEVTLVYEGLSDISVSAGDTIYSYSEIGFGTPDGEGTSSFTVGISSGGIDVSWTDLYASTNAKAPPLCEVPEELQEYAARAGGNRVAVAYTLADALLQGDERAVDSLMFGQYAISHSFLYVYESPLYPFESLDGFVCSGAWIDVRGEGENARVWLTLDVESAGSTGLEEGLCVYEVESRAEPAEYLLPENTVSSMMGITGGVGLDGDLERAVEMVQQWRLWCSAQAFEALDADSLPYNTELFLALTDREATGKTEWTREDLTELALHVLGVEDYEPRQFGASLLYNLQSGTYTIPEMGEINPSSVTSWDAFKTDTGAQVTCVVFADGLGCIPAYQYTYELESWEGGFTLRSCTVDSLSKLLIREVPVTGEALSDERALAVCRALLEREAQLDAWMFGADRRTDGTRTVQQVQDGVLVTYARSLDYGSAEELAESLQNVSASLDPLTLSGMATRAGTGERIEVPLCCESDGVLYTVQAYLVAPYREIGSDVRLEYVSDERITFTVSAVLQSGGKTTLRATALASDGRWTLEAPLWDGLNAPED